MKVLIVDDSATIRKKLKRVLEEGFSYSVSEVDSGGKAIDILKSQSFDLITLDLNMEGLNGWDVCDQIRNNKTFQEKGISNIPIIFITEMESIDLRRKGFEMGGTDFLSKGELCKDSFASVFSRLQNTYSEVSSSQFVIIEPSQTFCRVLEAHLKMRGGFVDSFFKPTQAMEHISRFSHQIDLVLTANHFPNDEGINVVNRLKTSSKTRQIPVLLLSSRELGWDSTPFFRAGVSDILFKDSTLDEFLSRISPYLKLQKLKKNLKVFQRDTEEWLKRW